MEPEDSKASFLRDPNNQKLFQDYSFDRNKVPQTPTVVHKIDSKHNEISRNSEKTTKVHTLNTISKVS